MFLVPRSVRCRSQSTGETIENKTPQKKNGRTTTIQPIVSMGRNLLISSAMAAHRPKKLGACTAYMSNSVSSRVCYGYHLSNADPTRSNTAGPHRTTTRQRRRLLPHLAHTHSTDRRRLNPSADKTSSAVTRSLSRHGGSTRTRRPYRGGRAGQPLDLPQKQPRRRRAKKPDSNAHVPYTTRVSYPTADAFDRTFVWARGEGSGAGGVNAMPDTTSHLSIFGPSCPITNHSIRFGQCWDRRLGPRAPFSLHQRLMTAWPPHHHHRPCAPWSGSGRRQQPPQGG